ncbi:ABC transporter permease [Planococcus shenhongbingii]|uniref:ABC transporter permease n=1 Tax=Planococcus shenhongbingii TaxID=3058398 RepID=A0ABT8NBK3_9BACL|nr:MULTISPECIES: ABC transporter permease [unclassified Planococcus (in: firmicutes)]MDN7245260.1 ABC transporter permease [Planococcus sp. N017]WKA58367.1 ABC transporter permease [Planococcus sp. N016]
MGRFIVKRIVESLFVLVIGSMLCFAFIRALPGDPAAAMYGDQLQKLSEADRLRIIENLGLNEALPIQYAKWLGQIFQGEWGHSTISGMDAAAVVAGSLQPTFLLLLSSQFLLLLLAVLFGVSTGLKHRSLYDHAVTAVSFIFLSIPPFWFALMLMIFFSVHLGILPTSGMGDGQLRYILLPSLVLALSHAGYYIRLLRNHIIITKDTGFIFALKARGFSQWSILKNHLLPNASIPLLSYAGMSLAVSLASSIVVETIFSWPGLGRLALKSALAHDYPVLLAILMLSMVFVILVNLFVDLLCAWIDPRLRHQVLGEGK